MSGPAPSAESSESERSQPLSVERYYSELCSNIRATDDISFKLLGFVPLISGAGIVAVLSAEEKLALPSAAVVLVALFATIVTLALYRWERRNIGICIWLIARAADVERAMLEAAHGIEQGTLQGLPPRHSDGAPTHDRAELERSCGLREGALQTQFLGPGEPGRFLLWDRFGKTEATEVLYGSAVTAWLAVVPITLLT
jgi:hypothetical protein